MINFSFRLAILLTCAALVVCPEAANAQFQMFTKNLTPLGSGTLTLDVESSDSIENVKQKNEDRLGYLPQNQFLFSTGTFLQDDRTLAEYGITAGATINMAVIDSFDALSFSGVLPGANSGFQPFMMRSGTSGAGQGWSVFNYTSAVDLSATGSGAYTLDLFTVAPAAPGAMPAFNGRQAYDWTFVTAVGGISGFSPDKFFVSTGNFANAFTGSFSVVQRVNSLAISYSPADVPEIDPSGMGSVLALVTGALGLLERRRLALGSGVSDPLRQQ